MNEFESEVAQSEAVARRAGNIFQRAWEEARKESNFDDAAIKYLYLIRVAMYEYLRKV